MVQRRDPNVVYAGEGQVCKHCLCQSRLAAAERAGQKREEERRQQEAKEGIEYFVRPPSVRALQWDGDNLDHIKTFCRSMTGDDAFFEENFSGDVAIGHYAVWHTAADGKQMLSVLPLKHFHELYESREDNHVWG